MYRAKASGKARCELFDTAMHASAVNRLQLETDLRKAVDRGEFTIHYQPIVHLESGKISGFEALIRWQRPDLGLVAPGEFLAVAEDSGLILPINRWVTLEACGQAKLWQSQYASDPPLTMSVNISARQFSHPDFVNDIRTALEQTGFNPGSLQLEILETIAMGDAERSVIVFSQLKALGVQLSIDDFGTGYSSLGRLRRFPVDTLKIDRSFISKMDTDADNRSIVRTIVALAHNLDLNLVAEGTETLEEVAELQKLECEYAQGYFFSRPIERDAAERLLVGGRQLPVQNLIKKL
jgi:EAL domain-containing protein (putative c-di-GMP-specific phosphodiesterase class I)